MGFLAPFDRMGNQLKRALVARGQFGIALADRGNAIAPLDDGGAPGQTGTEGGGQQVGVRLDAALLQRFAQGNGTVAAKVLP